MVEHINGLHIAKVPVRKNTKRMQLFKGFHVKSSVQLDIWYIRCLSMRYNLIGECLGAVQMNECN